MSTIENMSTIEKTTQWLERASDYCNPILVKETRQSLKSRQFVVTFMLLLIASWLISVFGMLLAGDAIEFGSTGRMFFYLYYCVLAVAIFVIVPFGAFRSLLNERDENTFELLSITTLSPRQIVWGKLLSSLVQVFIYYSAIAPFIAFTSLLQGFDFTQVMFILGWSLLVSLACSMTSLMLSTVGRQKHWQSLTSLVVLGGLVWLLFVSFGMLGMLLRQPLPFDDADFWWGMGFALAAGISYLILFQQITTAQLTFESDNRSSAIRLTCAVQFWLLWVILVAYYFVTAGLSTIDEDVVFVIASLSLIHWLVVGLFATTETEYLSRRIRRSFPRSAAARLLYAPFLPGGSRGLVYFLFHIMALWLIATSLLAQSSRASPEDIYVVTGMCCYAVIYIGAGVFLGRLGQIVSSQIRPAHVRVLILLLFAGGAVGPYLPAAIGLIDWRVDNSLLYITNPFATLDDISRPGYGTSFLVAVLCVTALLAVFVNLRAMLLGLATIINDRTSSRSKVVSNAQETALKGPMGAAPE